jgi:hypothetical protein
MKQIIDVVPKNTWIRFNILKKESLLLDLKQFFSSVAIGVLNVSLLNYAFECHSADAMDPVFPIILFVSIFLSIPTLFAVYSLFDIPFNLVTKQEYHDNIILVFEKEGVKIYKNNRLATEVHFNNVESIALFLGIEVKEAYSLMERELIRVKHEKEDSELRLSKILFQFEDY